MSTVWTCARCGGTHDGLATVFGPPAPDAWLGVSEDQRAQGELTDDQCHLIVGDTTLHFIRGHLEIPVRDASTLDLPTHVHTRAPGVVPLVELDPGVDHPLVREQRDGITWHRVAELNKQLLGTTP